MLIRSTAKINLALSILGQDEVRGYHFIKSVLQEIPFLFDEIEIKNSLNEEIEIVSDDALMPTDERNTIYQAARLLKEHAKMRRGVFIKIKKNIPIGAGLGGGSSNAAAVLKALNQMWKLGLSNHQLRGLGAKIGMDVPFFIEGGTAIGSHFGEIIEILPAVNGLEFKIVTPKAIVDTAEAYKKWRLNVGANSQAKTDFLIAALRKYDTGAVLANIHNDFESLIYPLYPEIAAAAEGLKARGFERVCLSGSGSSVFGARRN